MISLLSSALYILSLTPWSTDLPALAHLQWFSFLPILHFLDRKNANNKETFLAGFIMSAGMGIGGFYWMIHAVQQYGGIPFPGALTVFIAFCAITQLQIPLYLILRKYFLSRWSSRFWILLSGFLYVGLESLYPKLFMDTAGFAFADQLYFSQLADIAGVNFITVLVIIFAESVIQAWKKQPRWLILPLVILLFGWSYGKYRVAQFDSALSNSTQQPKLKIAAVQANIGDYLKIAAEQGLNNASEQVISEYLKYSKEAALNQPDAIVWPETAYSALFGKPSRMDEKNMEDRLREFSSQFPGTMIFGGYDQNDFRSDFNSIFFLPQSQAFSSESPKAYHKNMLLMFGETLPFVESFPSMKKWFPTMGFFGRGPGPEVFSVNNSSGQEFKVAPSICYEGLFSYFSAEGALLGADAMINVTNDSWFGPHGEPYLHFALTRFRSIETRLPMIRSTNTGITAAIDSLGRVTSKTDLMVPAVLHAEIPLKTGIKSPYLAIASIWGGHWFERIFQILFLVVFSLLLILHRKAQRVSLN